MFFIIFIFIIFFLTIILGIAAMIIIPYILIRTLKYKWYKFKRLEEEEKERNKYWK